jgi:hypothetical protein
MTAETVAQAAELATAAPLKPAIDCKRVAGIGNRNADMPATDLLAGLDHSEIPDTCTCTWSWGPPGFRWERIGIKEDCPWHRIGDMTHA